MFHHMHIQLENVVKKLQKTKQGLNKLASSFIRYLAAKSKVHFIM